MSESKCLKYDSCSGSKIMFIPKDKRYRFPYTRNGYLPPLCNGCSDYQPSPEKIIIEKEVYVGKVTDGEFRRLQSLVTYLQEKVNHITDKKSRSKYD
jgi:hypothetical protein